MTFRKLKTSDGARLDDVAQPEQQRFRAKHLRFKTFTIWAVTVVAASLSTWLVIDHPWETNPNPFTPAVAASVQFPLFYPTTLPRGFHIDTKSVSEPSVGVIVITLLGPSGEKLYMSEEQRQATFNLGGFYKSLTNLSQTPVSDGEVAVGQNGRTEIASRANNTTWILANTNAQIPQAQLISMLKSLTHGF